MDWLNQTHIGDCRELLAAMAADGVKVQTCVTSPPYFGLRDYGTARWEGGAPDCDHVSTRGGQGGEGDRADRAFTARPPFKGSCGKCGAARVDGQIGLEASPAEYVAELVRVFSAVRKVLVDDGTLWLNLGDSYATDGGHSDANCADRRGAYNIGNRPEHNHRDFRIRANDGVKAKDLIGIPWRVALALQADGWYLRSDIIWHKPNPMPESVTDRPTKCHEYIFLLSKSSGYYYDAEAIKEPAYAGANSPNSIKSPHGQGFSRKAAGNRKTFRGGGAYTHGQAFQNDLAPCNDSVGNKPNESLTRNRRSVWTVATTPFDGAHFATFPRALIEPCIIAGAPAGAVVLDPFMGSGTTGQVAVGLGRQFIGCELNGEYLELQDMRKTTVGMPW